MGVHGWLWRRDPGNPRDGCCLDEDAPRASESGQRGLRGRPGPASARPMRVGECRGRSPWPHALFGRQRRTKSASALAHSDARPEGLLGKEKHGPWLQWRCCTRASFSQPVWKKRALSRFTLGVAAARPATFAPDGTGFRLRVRPWQCADDALANQLRKYPQAGRFKLRLEPSGVFGGKLKPRLHRREFLSE